MFSAIVIPGPVYGFVIAAMAHLCYNTTANHEWGI